MDYQTIKMIHLYSVIASLSFFIVRAIWMLQKSPLLHKRWVKVSPHFIDTVLLGSAVALSLQIGQYPFVHSWLTIKVLLLLVYIVAGAAALKYAKKRLTQMVSLLIAIFSASWIVASAVTKSPWGLLKVFFNM